MANDTIIISDLEVSYHVGVTEEERSKPQRLLLTLELSTDFGSAVVRDELDRTIDYNAVSQRLLRFGKGREWRLIETVAADIAAMVLKEFRPKTVSVEVKKFIIPQARHVAVRLTRPA
jgi:dihydroneopterin aldolase